MKDNFILKKLLIFSLFGFMLTSTFLLPGQASASESAVDLKLQLLKQATSSSQPLIDKTLLKKSLSSKRIGAHVNQGDIIGYEGGLPGTCGAGYSTGAHLHFEVKKLKSKTQINPRDYLGKLFIWPLAKYRITQEFGTADWTPWYKFHPGIDMTASYRAPVRAAAAGRIVFDGQYDGYGHLIIIDHGNGLRTYYGHLVC